MRVGKGTRRRGSGAAQPRSDAGEDEASAERQASAAKLVARGPAAVRLRGFISIHQLREVTALKGTCQLEAKMAKEREKVNNTSGQLKYNEV